METIQSAYLFVINSWDTVAVATVILAFLTAFLAYFTWVLAREARKTREQQLQPNIVVTVEPSELATFYSFLIIENVGQGVAYDVSIKESEDYTFNDKKNFKLNNLAFMKLKVLKSGQKIEHLLGKFEDLPSKTFRFDVTAKDAVGHEVKCSNTVDVNCYYDRVKFNEKNMDDLVDVLKKFERNLSGVVSGSQRLKVDTYNDQNREQEREKLIEQHRKSSNSLSQER